MENVHARITEPIDLPEGYYYHLQPEERDPAEIRTTAEPKSRPDTDPILIKLRGEKASRQEPLESTTMPAPMSVSTKSTYMTTTTVMTTVGNILSDTSTNQYVLLLMSRRC